MRRNRRLIQSLLLLAVALFLLYRISNRGPEPGASCVFEERVPTSELVYVSHARCRMRCRNVDQRLVEKVYLEGAVNCGKSSPDDEHPRYALEKRDDRGDKIRVIVEDDDGKHVIITVIRLGKSDKCTCS